MGYGAVSRGLAVMGWHGEAVHGKLCSGGRGLLGCVEVGEGPVGRGLAVVVGSGAFGWARLGKFGRSWFGNTGHGTVGLGKAVVVRQRMSRLVRARQVQAVKLRSGWVGRGRLRSGVAVN